MRILLCCTGGFPTSMLTQNMEKVVRGSAKLSEEDFKFTATPADSLKEEVDNQNMVLIGPQVLYKTDFIGVTCKPGNVSFTVIDKGIYGQMDGAIVLKPALVIHKKHEIGE